MKILKTKDYDLFTFDEGNQKRISNKHVNRLSKSIKENDFTHLKPINVFPLGDGRYLIIDGQNRFTACKRLDKHIYYIVSSDMNISHVQKVHTAQKSHSMNEILDYYEIHGHNDYKVYAMFKRTYGFSHSICLMLLSNTINTEKFKLGEFRVNSLTQAQKFADQAKDFKDLNFKQWNSRSFILALLDVFTHPEYDHKRMMHKVALQPRSLVKCSSYRDYVIMLEDIYNYYDSVKIRFV